MHIVRVIPYAVLPRTVPQVLSYFWPQPMPRGAVVRAPLGHRVVQAVVVASADVASGKMALRSASFQARPLSGVVHADPQVAEVQLQLAEWLSAHYATGLGTCLRTACPQMCPARPSAVSPTPVQPAYRISEPKATVAWLRSLPSRRGAVLVIAPDGATAESLAAALAPRTPLLVHSGIGVRALRAAYRSVADGTVWYVIGTRSALFLPWGRLAHIIVEDPVNDLYKHEGSPRYFTPDVARQLAALTGASLTLLSPAPVITAEYLARNALVRRSVSRPAVEVTAVPVADRGVSLLSAPAADAVRDANRRRAPVFVYSARKAFATAAVCARCRASPSCDACAIPLRLWRRMPDQMLLCYRCGAYRDLPLRCESCGTGALRPSGFAGSQRIADELGALAGTGEPVPVLDADLIRTPSDAARVWTQFDAMAHPMLVGSAMAFAQRYRRTFDTVIVPDADALMTNPDFRTTERTLCILEKLLDFRPVRAIIQHRAMDSLIDAVVRRDWSDVIERELSDRRAFSWPPFGRLVLLKVRDRDRRAAHRVARTVVERLHRVADRMGIASLITLQGPSPSWVPQTRGFWTEQLLVSSRADAAILGEYLAHLPPGVAVDVDPQSIA